MANIKAICVEIQHQTTTVLKKCEFKDKPLISYLSNLILGEQNVLILHQYSTMVRFPINEKKKCCLNTRNKSVATSRIRLSRLKLTCIKCNFDSKYLLRNV